MCAWQSASASPYSQSTAGRQTGQITGLNRIWMHNNRPAMRPDFLRELDCGALQTKGKLNRRMKSDPLSRATRDLGLSRSAITLIPRSTVLKPGCLIPITGCAYRISPVERYPPMPHKLNNLVLAAVTTASSSSPLVRPTRIGCSHCPRAACARSGNCPNSR